MDGTSWFVFYSYSRPLPRLKELKGQLVIALERARARRDLQNEKIRVTHKFHLSFARASKTHQQLFVLGAWDDYDSGGFVVSEMADNLRVCIAEKTLKVSKVRSRYSQWWLVLEDRISYGVLDESDRTFKIILLNPLNPATAFEL